MRGSKIAIATAIFCVCVPVHAQSVDTLTPSLRSFFDRNQSIAVADRQPLGYERRGIDVGVVNVQPSMEVDLFAVDNLYATETDRVKAAAVQLRPSVISVVDLGHTYAALNADAEISKYTRSSENNNLFGIGANGRQDLGGGFSLRMDGLYRRQAERRSDPGAINTSVRPILFDLKLVDGSLTWEHNRVLLRGFAGYNNITYRNGRLSSGAVLLQDYRDRDSVRAGLRGEYALTSALSLVGQFTRLRNQYRQTSLFGGLDRSSTRLEALGGASFEFTDLLRGELTLGFVSLDYDSPVFRAFSGFGGRAKVEYMPSLLTTITIKASRTIEEAGLPQSPYYFHTTASVTVDHELYRNVILSGYVGYETNRFYAPNRSDRRPSVGVSGQYRLNRAVALTARYDYLGVTSVPRPLGRNLTLNAASLGVNVGF